MSESESLVRDGLRLSTTFGADLLSEPIWSAVLVAPKPAGRSGQAIPRQAFPMVRFTVLKLLRSRGSAGPFAPARIGILLACLAALAGAAC